LRSLRHQLGIGKGAQFRQRILTGEAQLRGEVHTSLLDSAREG